MTAVSVPRPALPEALPAGLSASMFEICQAISSTLELQPLLDLILELVTREMRAQQGSILLLDRDGEQLRMLATRGMPREVVERGYIPRRGSIAEWVIEHAEPVILNDRVTADARFSSIASDRSIRSSMCVPLHAKGKVIGTLNIARTEIAEQFGPEDLSTVQIMASQAAVAIENARLHSELLQATRLATLGQTVSGISHCIKNILTGVKGGITIVELAFEDGDEETRRRGWEMLKRNINRISLLVLDMLDFSKSRRPVRSPVDLPALVRDVFDTLQYRADETGVRLLTDFPPGLPPMRVDPDQFFRCLLNVVGNAIDASNSGSEVTVRAIHLRPDETAYRMFVTDGQHAYTVIEVTDHGCGIPAHLIEKIFDPFYSTKGSKGTGLGMAVTRKIVEEHGGALQVDSQPGCGTTVRFLVPEIDEEPHSPRGA